MCLYLHFFSKILTFIYICVGKKKNMLSGLCSLKSMKQMYSILGNEEVRDGNYHSNTPHHYPQRSCVSGFSDAFLLVIKIRV